MSRCHAAGWARGWGAPLRAALGALLLALPALCLAQQSLDDLDADQTRRYRTLIHELRCLVCQNQTIADSNAPLALDLREQVHKQIVAGRSDGEIRTYLTDRYGDFVLYKPPFKAGTALLWIGPFGGLALALLVAWRFTRRSRQAPAPARKADAEALRRLLDEDSRGS